MVGDLEAVSVLERAGRASRRAGAMATAVARFDAAVAMAGDWAPINSFAYCSRYELIAMASRDGWRTEP
jgi:hypothetical protein